MSGYPQLFWYFQQQQSIWLSPDFWFSYLIAMFEVSIENRQIFNYRTFHLNHIKTKYMFETLARRNHSHCVCGITNSSTANHWLFFAILSWTVIVLQKKKKKLKEGEDTGFPPIAWLASPVCPEPNGLWDWWPGNEHTCWNQLAIPCSPTIKAI